MRSTPFTTSALTRLVDTTLLVIGLAASVQAQAVRLQERGSGRTVVPAAPGDTVQIDVRADFGRYSAAGLTVYVSVPSRGFDIIATGAEPISPSPGAGIAAPFHPGPLFADAFVVRNHIVARGLDVGPDRRLLEFSAVFGPAAERGRLGAGRIAGLILRCLTPGEGIVTVYDSPLHESRIVLADGRTEKPLRASEPVRIRVKAQTAAGPTSWAALKRARRHRP